MVRTAFVALGMGLVTVSAAAQGRGAPPAPPTDTVAPEIPGVVAAGAGARHQGRFQRERRPHRAA